MKKNDVVALVWRSGNAACQREIALDRCRNGGGRDVGIVSVMYVFSLVYVTFHFC